MTWTTPDDLRAQVQKRWDRGDLLRALSLESAVRGPVHAPEDAGAPDAWPLRLTLKGPTAQDLSTRFDQVRAWVAALEAVPRLRLVWREWQHRVQGAQRVPVEAWLDQAADALALIGQQPAARRFEGLWQATATAQPALLPWLQRRPLQALALAEHWPALMAVVAWVQAHPRSGVYLREVDVSGVDSKFIEAHRAVLAECLDLVLPAEAVDPEAQGVAQFARRYGFLEKPLRVRLRLLDPCLCPWPARNAQTRPADLSLDVDSLAAWDLSGCRVYITENETNFLAFPARPGALVIFGAGYGWEALARISWLRRCPVRYWGDIDTHGFAILDQLRGVLPQARSMLMDQATLLAHRAHWAVESQPATQALSRLNVEEASLYDALRRQEWGPGVRLEQERVSQAWWRRALAEDEAPAEQDQA